MRVVVMSDKQFAFLYGSMFMLMVVIYIALSSALTPVTGVQGYADKLCQEIYGPQTGAVWMKKQLFCQTVRGEILELRSE